MSELFYAVSYAAVVLSDSRSYRCTETYCFKFRLMFLCGMCVHVLSSDRSSRVSILGLETQFECLGLGMQSQALVLGFGRLEPCTKLRNFDFFGNWSFSVKSLIFRGSWGTLAALQYFFCYLYQLKTTRKILRLHH